MKNIINVFLISLCIISTTAYSQSPTKEQTIDFLKSYYQGKASMTCTDYSGSASSYSNSFKLINIKDLGNCEYQFVYEWDLNYKNDNENLNRSSHSKYTIIINFNKVEELSYYSTQKGDCKLYYIQFKGAPGAKFTVTEESVSFGTKETKTYTQNEVKLPGNNQYASDEISEETKKIRKAFNHLRKLCGAPDPIIFD